ncbi:SDR family oxidoreductase [Paralimibaculum aggregatum]|uniref:SDR family oxidoreductase n=1 Tax=Paralimibaculum aggregatum TaxID=3036245 RepID=A0ABQ6LN52_9RHOB|nr:D-erythronate dehydrogenase [Limibaculum sp. NKW23]GMG84616.1 SDR family oxidoreductase [Limibaculum sp. NKW23]
MRVLIIGGGGFLGQKLARRLAAAGELAGRAITALTLADLAPPAPVTGRVASQSLALDITDMAATGALIGAGHDVIYHLAAVVSGQAEAEFDLGMAVNLDGARHVFEGARALGAAEGSRPMVIFTSSIAVYGGELPEPIPDWAGLTPTNSYGAQKAAGELMLADYSRKGFLDGRALRLPTISIRPGKPNKAASSFMSSIFREPLQGEPAICPVSPDYTHWFLSPRACIENLVHAATIPDETWGPRRALALPGRTHRIGDMVEAMRRVAGDAPCELIRWQRDPEIESIVLGWKARLDPARALELGFVADASFEDNIRYFLEDDILPASH